MTARATGGWVACLPCTRAEADAAAAADDPLPGVEPPPTLVACETAEGWKLILYTSHAPGPALLVDFAALAPSAATAPVVGALPAADWVTLSQAGLPPVSVGRFHIHTVADPGVPRPGQRAIRIDAGLAFGTGQHATTAGCLAALQRLARRGPRIRAVLDCGTGSGLVAIAAAHLHRRAVITATDIDPVSVRVAAANARLNGLPPGRIRTLAANGVADARALAHAPACLVVANILAGPLVRLAPTLAPTVRRGGHLMLAGLLAHQQPQLIARYARAGFVLQGRLPHPDWPVLILRRTRPSAKASALRAIRRAANGRRASADFL